ncbi:MAG: heme exporter protein CcmD [Gammaproteobacteria bacterium]|nr:heme exporter protein CcmD [Gammaproteobacteria bacterium]
MAEFFAIGGYAAYVWPAFGLTLVVLVANVLAPIGKRRALLKQIAKRIARTGKLAATGRAGRSNR